jgi:hypothetical protein
MNGSFAFYRASIDVHDKTLTLIKGTDNSSKSILTFERPAPDRLMLDGILDGHELHMQLQLMDRKKLLRPGFHWIREY